ncbi:MAG: hypothetical protein Q9166_002688 [cf. Caloplaca sp. 2 TL-2023]
MDTTMADFDIVIVGAGPAGLFLAVCLVRWGYKVKHIDNRDAPTVTGRADGIQPRSLHILRNMGLKRQIMDHEPAKIYKVSFWNAAPAGKGIHKTGNWPACPDFIGARYPFTTSLHQGLIEKILIEDMRKHGVGVQRPWTITDFVNSTSNTDYTLQVSLKHVQTDETETVRTKYLFSGEGAKSFIRNKLGFKVHHKDPVSHIWAVMDGVVRTDFPDVKIASSADENLRSQKQASEDEVQASAKKILAPYHIEWDHVEWYSVYSIGQGNVEKYSWNDQIFLGGDCCHTHSVCPRYPALMRMHVLTMNKPKAGQGMNTAFHDGLNLAWKIHHVEAGFADRSVLSTYESERKLIAENLLDFDAHYAALFSQRIPSTSEMSSSWKVGDTDKESDFVKTFKANQEFTSGYGIHYPANKYNWSLSHPASSDLFLEKQTKLRPGYVMPSVDVIRVVDANVVQLEQEVPFNGSFRIFIFAGKLSTTRQALDDLAAKIEEPTGFYAAYERRDKSTVSYHERHNPHSHFFTLCTIFAAPRDEIEIPRTVPRLLARYSHHIYADDVWNSREPDAKACAHAKMGLDAEEGGVLVVRPDGHVGCTVRLVKGRGTVDALNGYFGAFVTKRLGSSTLQGYSLSGVTSMVSNE